MMCKHNCITVLCIDQVAAEVAAPLAKTDEIVLLGGGTGVTGDVTRLVSELNTIKRVLVVICFAGEPTAARYTNADWCRFENGCSPGEFAENC